MVGAERGRSGPKDYYTVLEVGRDASPGEIKASFRRLAKKFHPDLNRDNPKEAEERFKDISEAYEVLADAGKRAEYDTRRPPKPFGPDGFRWESFSHFDDLEDLFGPEAAAVSMESLFGRGRAAGRGPRRGADVSATVRISLHEVATGAERAVKVARWSLCPGCVGTGGAPGMDLRQCPACGGLGQVKSVQSRGSARFISITSCHHCRGKGRVVEAPCARCAGRGRVQEVRSLFVRVPPGVESGVRLRLPGEGDEGTGGGERGDAFVTAHVDTDPRFRRDGSDLTLAEPVYIDYTTAALGGEATVTALTGAAATLRIPPGTQTGTTFRLRGTGLPDNYGNAGDLFVRVEVSVPERLGDDERALLEQLKGRQGKRGAGERMKEWLRSRRRRE